MTKWIILIVVSFINAKIMKLTGISDSGFAALYGVIVGAITMITCIYLEKKGIL